MTTPPQCFKCGKTRSLKKCNDCDTVFCVHCAAPIISPGADIPEVINACIKCGSGNVIHLEDTFSQT